MSTRATTGDRRLPSRGDRQRAAIIAATTRLLATVPIGKLSVSRIAEEASVTRPGIYFYFESKHAVVAAALTEIWGEFDAARTAVAVAPAGTPADAVRSMIGGALEVWNRHAPLLNACLQSRSTDEQLSAMWDAFVGDSAVRVVELIDGLAKRGAVHPVADDLQALVEALLVMTLWSVLDDSTASSRRPSEDRVLDVITKIWVISLWGTDDQN